MAKARLVVDEVPAELQEFPRTEQWLLVVGIQDDAIKVRYRLFQVLDHGLSRLGVFLDTQTLKKAPLRTPNFFCEEFLKMSISSIKIEYFHLHIISMILYKDIMLYFDKFIYVYGWNLSILLPT